MCVCVYRVCVDMAKINRRECVGIERAEERCMSSKSGVLVTLRCWIWTLAIDLGLRESGRTICDEFGATGCTFNLISRTKNGAHLKRISRAFIEKTEKMSASVHMVAKRYMTRAVRGWQLGATLLEFEQFRHIVRHALV